MAQVSLTQRLVHQHERETQRLGVSPEIDLEFCKISVDDAVPKQHPPAKRAVTIQDHAQALGATENESSHSSCKLANSLIQIFHEVEKFLKSHQLDGLNNAGIANNGKTSFGVFALLGKLNKNAQARRVEKINLDEVDHGRGLIRFQHISHVGHELTLGIGIKLTGEMKHHTATLLLEATPKRNG
jgi:hypothetical protein